MMDRAKFYGAIRRYPFPNRLMQSQVDGMEIMLDAWDQREEDDSRWLAYILATTFHETAYTMQPIAEYGKGKGRKYGKADPETGQTYYGRGFVQITWKDNYSRFGDLLDIDMVNDPDQALDVETASRIIFEGMTRGMFTGRGLKHYFKPGTLEGDWFNARKIINRLDKAERIARYGRAFWRAILIAEGKLEDVEVSTRTTGLEDTVDEYDELEDEFSMGNSSI